MVPGGGSGAVGFVASDCSPPSIFLIVTNDTDDIKIELELLHQSW